MFRSWKIGSLFGIGIYVHATFFLLPLFILFSNLGAGQIALAFHALMIIPAVFACVVLHELGHALTARHYGIETRDITLYPIGGVARLERLPQRPWEEFWIAVAGPAVNVVIAALLGIFCLFFYAMDLPTSLSESMFALVPLELLLVNLMLVGFNLLPAFPMDGGRVLRALLATRLGQLQATTIAVQIGVAMAIVFGLVGMASFVTGKTGFFFNPMLALIGLFVFFAGQQELAGIRYRYAFRSREPLDVIPVSDEEFDWPTTAPRGGFSGFTWDAGSGRWIEWRNGRPIHSISVN